MAVLLGPQSFFGGIGTLARASLAGGLPREVLERVTEADWGPDGALAVVKQGENKMELEFPVGTKLHERGRSGRCVFRQRAIALRSSSRALPAWAQPERWSLWTVPQDDHPGETIDGSRPRLVPPGDEVWFSGARSDGPPAIRAVSLSGRSGSWSAYRRH